MVIVGAGMNHWYHMDMNYRGIINMLVMCGCVGQSRRRLVALCRPGKAAAANRLAAARVRSRLEPSAAADELDLGFFYAHTDQWRYETLDGRKILSPTAPAGPWDGALIDYNVRAERMGWLPSAPQLQTNPLEVSKHAAAAGMEAKDYVAKALKSRRAEAVLRDPDNPGELAAQHVRLALQPARAHRARATNISSSICSAPSTACMGKDLGEDGKKKPSRSRCGTTRRRKESSTCWSRSTSACRPPACIRDIVLPTATWYEKNDLNTSDMHPFIHPLSAAVDPVWESRSDWDIYKGIAQGVLARSRRKCSASRRTSC